MNKTIKVVAEEMNRLDLYKIHSFRYHITYYMYLYNPTYLTLTSQQQI